MQLGFYKDKNITRFWCTMSRRESNEVQIEFHDVPAYFSNEEWMLLHGWQKELYRNVMEEIHKALLSLGPLIATTLFSLRTKEKEDLCRMDSLDSERRHQINSSPGQGLCSLTDGKSEEENILCKIIAGKDKAQVDCRTNPDVLHKINKEEYIHRNNRHDSEESKRSLGVSLSAEFPFLKSEVPLIKQEEPVSVFSDHQDTYTDPDSAYEIVSFCINGEEDTYCLDRQDTTRTETIKQPPAGGEANPGKRKSRDSLKETVKSKPSRVSSGFANVNMTESYAKGIGSGNPAWPNIKHQLPGMEILQCESSVSNSAHLSFHLNALGGQTTEMDLGERKYQCQECERSFKRKDNLNVHQRTHTGERPYRCVICMKSFNQKGILNRHQIVHLRKKHYPCSQCEKKFSDKRILLEHQKVHNYPNMG